MSTSPSRASNVIDEQVFRERLAGTGKGFVLASVEAARSLEDEASTAFEAMDSAIRSLGGWLVEDGVLGARSVGFSRLMEERTSERGRWEVVCPVPSGKARSRQTMKLPANMLVHQGFPCWALAGRCYSLDLLNPGNELGLAEVDTFRYWHIIPWLPDFLSGETADFQSFSRVIGAVAVAVQAEFGMGGVGLAQFMINSRRAVGGVFGRLQDLALPFMLLKRRIAADVLDTVGIAGAGDPGHSGRCSRLFEFGEGPGYVLVGASLPRDAYPIGGEAGTRALGRALGRRSLADMIEAYGSGRTPEGESEGQKNR